MIKVLMIISYPYIGEVTSQIVTLEECVAVSVQMHHVRCVALNQDDIDSVNQITGYIPYNKINRKQMRMGE